MLNVIKEAEGTTLTVTLEGRLDSNTAPELDKMLQAALDGKTALIMNFEKLAYISSAGLRALLRAQQTMDQQGTMVIRGVSSAVREIFDVTGFSDILTIE